MDHNKIIMDHHINNFKRKNLCYYVLIKYGLLLEIVCTTPIHRYVHYWVLTSIYSWNFYYYIKIMKVTSILLSISIHVFIKKNISIHMSIFIHPVLPIMIVQLCYDLSYRCGYWMGWWHCGNHSCSSGRSLWG